MTVSVKSISSVTPERSRLKESKIGISQGPSFSEALKNQLPMSPSKEFSLASGGLKFSNHAIDRIRSRGISATSDDMKNVEKAVEKAATKGSKNTLVLNNNSAWIVNVDNRTVVTVMDKAMLKENVFTNIDSTIVI